MTENQLSEITFWDIIFVSKYLYHYKMTMLETAMRAQYLLQLLARSRHVLQAGEC